MMSEIRKRFSREKGFTLIELLIVLGIIGVLIGLALLGMRFAQRRARDTQRKNNVRNLQIALEAYYTDNQNYPASATNSAADLVGSGKPLQKYLEEGFDPAPEGNASDYGYHVGGSGNVEYGVCVLPEEGDCYYVGNAGDQCNCPK